eukprot:gene25886-biopygen11262
MDSCHEKGVRNTGIELESKLLIQWFARVHQKIDTVIVESMISVRGCLIMQPWHSTSLENVHQDFLTRLELNLSLGLIITPLRSYDLVFPGDSTESPLEKGDSVDPPGNTK